MIVKMKGNEWEDGACREHEAWKPGLVNYEKVVYKLLGTGLRHGRERRERRKPKRGVEEGGEMQ